MSPLPVVNTYANATEGNEQNKNPQDDKSRRDSADDMDLGIADTEDMTESDWDPFKGLKAPFGYSYDGSWPFFALVPQRSTSRKSFVWEDQNSTTPKQRRRFHVPP